jgi:hypothetical protein
MEITHYAYTLQSYNDKKRKLETKLLLAKENKDIPRYNNIIHELENIDTYINFRKSQCKNMLKNRLIAKLKDKYLYNNLDIIKKNEFIMIKLMDDYQLLLSLSIYDISTLEKKLENFYLEWNDE